MLSSILSIRQEQFRMSTTMNHLVICGYDVGSRMLLDAVLAEADPQKTELVIFAPGERPLDIPTHFKWISGDPAKESELDKARIAYASACIVVGSRVIPPQDADAKTILTIFTLHSFLRKNTLTAQRKSELYVTAEILDAENVAHARAAGADEVIETTRLGFSLLSHAVHQRGSADVMGMIASQGAYNLYIGTPPEDVFLPSTYMEVTWRVKKTHGGMVIGVQLPDGENVLNPPDAFTVLPEHQLIYLDREASLD